MFTKKEHIRLSWSMLSLFENNPKQFKKQYFLGEEIYKTPEMIFGTCVGNIIETGSYDIDEVLDSIEQGQQRFSKKPMPNYEIKRYMATLENILTHIDFLDRINDWRFETFANMEVELKETIADVPCTGHIDNASQDLHRFREFKTGKTPWTQDRANNHGQLYMYALLIEKNTGKLPDEVYLDWFETTQDEAGNIYPTGKIETFPVKILPEKCEHMKQRIAKVYGEIIQAFEEFQSNQSTQVENIDLDIYQTYREKMQIIKQTEAELAPIKKLIFEDMTTKQMEDIKLPDGGMFYFTTRKSYDYPDEITQKEAEIKQAKKEYEQTHQPKTVTNSLAFKL